MHHAVNQGNPQFPNVFIRTIFSVERIHIKTVHSEICGLFKVTGTMSLSEKVSAFGAVAITRYNAAAKLLSLLLLYPQIPSFLLYLC